jgi:hypothetical protein
MMLANVQQRTFRFKWEHYTGTAFTLEREGTQYLVTTTHTLPYPKDHEEIEFSIMRNNEWQVINSVVHKHPNTEVDVVILTLPQDISPRPEIILKGDTILGFDTYFLGFPYGRFMDDKSSINNGFPIPYIKKGILSAFPAQGEDVRKFFLDGINNPGFSGGPCYFISPGQRAGRFIPTILGVVKGYVPNQIEIEGPLGTYFYEENSGLVEVHDITHLNEIVI